MRAAISREADVNGRGKHGRTALHYAASVGNVDAVDVLLNAGATELQDERGDTPSHSAASAGRLSCVKRLMERGADPYIRNRHGRRPVHEAMRAGHTSVVRSIEEWVCPFRATVRHKSSLLWVIDTSHDVWMVVHRARPLDNPRVDRSANRVQLFAGRDAASHSVEVLNARVVRVTPGPGGSQVVLEGSGREVELCMTRQQSDWLTFVLGGSFASGTGPNFDSMGNVVQPAWMLSQNVHFPAGGAAKPSAAAASLAAPTEVVRPAAAAGAISPEDMAAIHRAMTEPDRPPAVCIPGGVPGSLPVPGHHAAASAPAASAPPMDAGTAQAAAAAGGAPARAACSGGKAAASAAASGASGALDAEYDDDEGAPNEFLCPILLELMRDPVIAGDGHSYEREAIVGWLANNSTSPKTGEALDGRIIIPNHTLRGQILEWIEKRRAARAEAPAREARAESDVLAAAVPPPAM